jgi:hypothetical protein
MGVRLTWQNNSVGDNNIVYRSTAPIDPGALPSPLAVLDDSVSSYDDVTTMTGVTYYYRVALVRGGSAALSTEVSINASPGVDSSFADELAADMPYLWWRLGELSGTSLADESGNGRSATLFGSTGQYTLGVTGLVEDSNKAIALHADAAFIRSSSTYLVGLTNKTYGIAFKSDPAAPAGVLTCLNSNSAPDTVSGARDRAFVLGSDGLLYFTFWDGSASRRLSSGLAVNDATRHLAHAVIDTTRTTLFLDGHEVSHVDYVPGYATNVYYFVGRTNITDQAAPINTNAGFRGVVDEAFIIDAALAVGRIERHAEAAGLF